MKKKNIFIYVVITVALLTLGCEDVSMQSKQIYKIDLAMNRYANTGVCESYIIKEGYYLCFGDPCSGKAKIYNEDSVVLDTSVNSENVIILYLNKGNKYELVNANLEFLTDESDDIDYIKSKIDK